MGVRTQQKVKPALLSNHVYQPKPEYDPIHPPDAITTHLPKENQYVRSSGPLLRHIDASIVWERLTLER